MRSYSRRNFFYKSGFAFSSLALFGKSNFFSPLFKTGSESLEEKIGQMLMVGFRGLKIDKNHPIVQDILVRHLGSVVLFDYDCQKKSCRKI